MKHVIVMLVLVMLTAVSCGKPTATPTPKDSPTASPTSLSCAASQRTPMKTHTVWFSLEISEEASYSFDISGSNYEMILVLWQGEFPDITNVECTTDTNVTITLPVDAYILEIASWDGWESGELDTARVLDMVIEMKP